jgi:hypothetical protein
VRDVILKIRDEAAPWNDGEWQIGLRHVRGAARWACEPASGQMPAAHVDIATFSALFAGFLTVPQAIDVGYLQADPGSVETLTSLFRTTYRPHSRDHF